jgi:hypothetical protein
MVQAACVHHRNIVLGFVRQNAAKCRIEDNCKIGQEVDMVESLRDTELMGSVEGNCDKKVAPTQNKRQPPK